MKPALLTPLFCALIFLGCDKGEDEIKQEEVVEMVVGSAGGSVKSSDGVVSISIPEASLSEDVTITIEKVSSPLSGNIGDTYKFGPEGIEFDTAVTISFNYSEDSVASNESDLGVFFVNGDSWEYIPTEIDSSGNIVKGYVDHFTTFGVLVAPVISTIFDNLWDVTLNYPNDVSWHADVDFYVESPKAYTKYDEPDYPGLYLSFGDLSLLRITYNDVEILKVEIVWDIGAGEKYVYTGTVNSSAKTMEGTHLGPGTWSAVVK
ncbi:hypothetical protein [Marinoscillum sp. MHG1-6]|uniref:hypothetical protein n=1 Tax=Marinoscillum sp. MHG1-6 TaxID=2959627 RepID=UPI0021576137|nr:hypothetical protein [Marinoscillum sp. MHG1-6]